MAAYFNVSLQDFYRLKMCNKGYSVVSSNLCVCRAKYLYVDGVGGTDVDETDLGRGGA